MSDVRAWILAAAASTGLLGCPPNACLLTVNGRCEWSTCGEGAEWDAARKTCGCRRDRISLGGACLTPAAASAYCGRGSHWEPGGCAPDRCAPGFELDQETGLCLSPQQVGAASGVQVGQGQKLACPPGQQLVVEGGAVACVPTPQTCARDEHWDGAQCRKVAACPPGSSWDAASGTCVRFSSAGQEKAYTVDLPTWMRTAYGPEGGEGTSAFCGAFRKHPLAFGVLPGGSIRAVVTVRVDAPDRQAPQARVATWGLVAASGQPVAPQGAALVQRGAESVLAPLVAAGGTTSVPSAITTVRCLIENASPPMVVPATGGA